MLFWYCLPVPVVRDVRVLNHLFLLPRLFLACWLMVRFLFFFFSAYFFSCWLVACPPFDLNAQYRIGSMAYLQQLAIHEHGIEERAEDLSKHPPLLLEEGLTVLHPPGRSRTISTSRLDAYSRSKPERKNSLITTTTSTSRIGIVACCLSFSQVLCAVSWKRSSFRCHTIS